MIVKKWRGSGTYANATEKVLYTYAAANQLIQEDLYYGSGNSSNDT